MSSEVTRVWTRPVCGSRRHGWRHDEMVHQFRPRQRGGRIQRPLLAVHESPWADRFSCPMHQFGRGRGSVGNGADPLGLFVFDDELLVPADIAKRYHPADPQPPSLGGPDLVAASTQATTRQRHRHPSPASRRALREASSRRRAGGGLGDVSVGGRMFAEECPFKVVRTNGSDEVLARAANLLIARAAFETAKRMYPLIEYRRGAQVIERSELVMKFMSASWGKAAAAPIRWLVSFCPLRSCPRVTRSPRQQWRAECQGRSGRAPLRS
jgi:hypothetical protein